MSNVLTWLVVALMGGLIVVQGVIVLRFVLGAAKAVAADRDRTWQPPAVIVLCLRGADPFLKQCVESLLAQQYATFRLYCLFDNADDPARDVIREFEDRAEIRVLVADTLRPHCSLKCNSLVTAFENLDAGTEVVALVDADTLVDPHWLADLVAPLSRDGVAVSSGNRWYTPRDFQTGTMIRYLWNLAAAPQMNLYRIPWGGSLALKLEFARKSRLPETWSRSLFEDVVLFSEAKRLGQRVEMLPGLMIPNGESISVTGACRWMQRQLLDTRLYHPSFPLTAAHCYFSLLVPGAAIGLFVAFLWSGQWSLALTLLATLGVYAGFYLLCLVSLEQAARRAMQGRNDLPPRPGIRWTTGWHIVITQLAYTLATTRALVARRTRWRGIEYRIGRSGRSRRGSAPPIERVSYRPMSECQPGDAAGNSVQ